MKYMLPMIAAACCLVCACEVERGESDFPDQVVEDAGGADAGPVSDVALGAGPGAGTMNGTWLLRHERSSCVLQQEQLTHATYLVEMDQHGATIAETRRLCETRLTPMFGMQVSIPDVVLENIDFVEVDRGLVSTLRVGGTYISSTEVAQWGLNLDDPTVDPVPDDADHESVIDADGDGNPGVTLSVGGDCGRYQGQRQLIAYRGSFTTPNQIDGASTGVTDLEVYGASEDFCAIAPSVESNDPHSRFRMVRIDGNGGAYDADTDGDDHISCAEALAVAEQVMEGREVDHGNCSQ